MHTESLPPKVEKDLLHGFKESVWKKTDLATFKLFRVSGKVL